MVHQEPVLEVEDQRRELFIVTCMLHVTHCHVDPLHGLVGLRTRARWCARTIAELAPEGAQASDPGVDAFLHRYVFDANAEGLG